MSNDCRKRYCVWVTCRLWYSNTEYIPLLVFEMHNFVLVHTQYIPVCTLKFRTYEYILVCTSMHQYKPGSYKKYCSCTTGHDSKWQGKGEHAPNMVLHSVQMQRYYMLHLLPKPLSMHCISLDHPKAHELTNHILQPSQEPGLLSPGAPGKTLCRGYRMVPVSPMGTTGSFPRILWMGMTWRTGFW